MGDGEFGRERARHIAILDRAVNGPFSSVLSGAGTALTPTCFPSVGMWAGREPG